MNKRLSRKFFERSPILVAQDLLGKYLIRQVGNKKVIAKIVETEAYMGEMDLASHASRGKTPRTEIMYNSCGIAYVYLVYGIHYMFNIVAHEKGKVGAVLIRALEPMKNQKMANGPGKLSKWMKIDIKFNGEDLIKSNKLWLEDYGTKPSKIIKTTRIGVEYAKHYEDKPWRFYIKDNPSISKK